MLHGQATRNLTQPLVGLDPETVVSLAKDSARWTDDAGRPSINMATFAHSALVAGDDLQAVGAAGPHATPAQRRAWAARALLGALYEIRAA